MGWDSSVGWSLGEWVGKPQNGNGLNIWVRYRIKSSRRPWQRWIMWRRNRLVVLTEEWKRKESDYDDVLIRNSVLSNCFTYRRSHGLSEENSAKKGSLFVTVGTKEQDGETFWGGAAATEVKLTGETKVSDSSLFENERTNTYKYKQLSLTDDFWTHAIFVRGGHSAVFTSCLWK